MYTWNVMFNHIMNIKHKYENKFEKYNHQSFKDMCIKLGYNDFVENTIITEYHHSTGELILIKYDMLGINTDLFTNPHSIYREGRSLVINLNTEEIVLCPFRKFFNIDEIEETSMSIVQEQMKTAKLIEFSNKLDGSMLSFRWYNDTLVSSSSGNLDPSKAIQLELGIKIFNSDASYLKMVKAMPEYTFIFEGIFEEDPHVVNYTGNSLNLIGIRNVYTGNTLTYKDTIAIGKQYNIPTTTLENTNMDDIIKNKSQYKSSDKEGWVIHIITNDNQSFRYKFKCDDYVKLHKILNALSSDNVIIQAIAENTYDDLIAQVPDNYKTRVATTANKVYEFLKIKKALIEKYYNTYKDAPSKKDFALAVNKYVPKDIVSYMFLKKNNKPYNLLCKYSNSFIKMNVINEFLDVYRPFYNKMERIDN